MRCVRLHLYREVVFFSGAWVYKTSDHQQSLLVLDHSASRNYEMLRNLGWKTPSDDDRSFSAIIATLPCKLRIVPFSDRYIDKEYRSKFLT